MNTCVLLSGAGAGKPAAWAMGASGQVRWMAVPKRKTSPHRRGIRRAHLKLKPRAEVAVCGCGQVLLAHQMCPKCLMSGGARRRAGPGPGDAVTAAA